MKCYPRHLSLSFDSTGILVTDHVSMDELEDELMQMIELEGHLRRMKVAYTRYIS